jgi:hypothetical protein
MIAKDERWLSETVVAGGSGNPGVDILTGRECDSIRTVFVVGNWARDDAWRFNSCVEVLDVSGSVERLNMCRFGLLRSVNLRPGLRRIAMYCFYDCSSLREVSIPDTMKMIGWCAFQNSGLVEIDLPEKMESIGQQAFYMCKSLRRIRLPRKLGVLGDLALCNTSLVNVELPIELGRAGWCILSGLLERLTVWNISVCDESAFMECKVGELIFRGVDLRVLESSKWRSVKRIKSTKFAGRKVLGVVVESE